MWICLETKSNDPNMFPYNIGIVTPSVIASWFSLLFLWFFENINFWTWVKGYPVSKPFHIPKNKCIAWYQIYFSHFNFLHKNSFLYLFLVLSLWNWRNVHNIHLKTKLLSLVWLDVIVTCYRMHVHPIKKIEENFLANNFLLNMYFIIWSIFSKKKE